MTPRFSQLSMRQQILARLFLSLAVSACVMLALAAWFYQYSGQRVLEHRLARVVEHFEAELADRELHWGREAHGFKSRLEYSRVLEDARQREQAFYSFLTAQSATLEFPVAFVARRDGTPLFGYARGREPLPVIRLVEGQDIAWHYDAGRNRLYRVFRQPVWLGGQSEDLLLLRPLTPALLLQLADPETSLLVSWEGQAVASSLGEAGLQAVGASLGPLLQHPGVRALPWVAGEPDGPQLVILLENTEVIPLARLLLPVLAGLALFMAVSWLLVGRWTFSTGTRLAALEGGSHGFVAERSVSERVRADLEAAAAGRNDELARVAVSLQYLMHDALAHELALQESERRYRFLVEGVQVIAWEFDPAKNAFTYVSPLVETMFGYPLADWLRPGFLGPLVHEDDRLLVDSMFRCVGGIGESCRSEFRLIARDGRVVYIEDISSAVLDEAGTRTYVRGVMIDVTDRKAAEERLTLAGMVFESAGEGIMVTDAENRIVSVNPAFETITGYPAAEVIGQNPRLLSSGRQDRTFYLGFWTALVTAGRWSGELWNRRKNGDFYVQRTSISTIRDPKGGVFRRVALFYDVTDERRKEQEIQELNATLERRVEQRTRALDESNRQLSQALESLRQTQRDLVRSEKLAGLGAIVAGVAHEMNTPIGNCLTVASALADRTYELRGLIEKGQLKKSDFGQYVDASEQATKMLIHSMERAHDLVSHFKQVAVDQTSEKRRCFDLAVVVEENLGMLRPGFKRLPHSIAEEIPSGIEMDSFPGPLGQVVSNMVINAMTHAFEGRASGTVTVSAVADTTQVTLRIEDDGVGMDEAVQRRAFDPFFTTKFGSGGSGLGLHIVFNIVSGVLGGSIRLESEAGKGTRFFVTLPRVAPAQASAAANRA